MASNEVVFSPADRIRQLNEIDKEVAQILQSAGLAIQALTNSTSQASNSAEAEDTATENPLEARKKAFKSACSQYFTLVSSVDVKLRRQVYALEESSIIRAESAVPIKGGDTIPGGTGPAAQTSSGIVNPLETSWLNSRKDTIGKDKEAELWAEARKFLESIASDSDLPVKAASSDEKESMEVD